MKNPKILFVAMLNSIHVARWITQFQDEDYDLHLFPSTTGMPHKALQRSQVKTHFAGWLSSRIGVMGATVNKHQGIGDRKFVRGMLARFERSFWLTQSIRKVRPDIVHSLEIQRASYQTFEAFRRLERNFPTWIVSNWGSDIYLFGRLSDHRTRIREVLSSCDYYWCECERDIDLAKQFGYSGHVLPVLPNGGGYDLDGIGTNIKGMPPSSRKIILVKGYQNWAGRALVALRAIVLSSKELKGYRILIYSAKQDVKIAAELAAQDSGLRIEVLPHMDHHLLMRKFGQARAYIGLSISDAISTSLLESMIMGAFPIQSCTSCADEWIENGKSGLIVPPEDPEEIAKAIFRAVSNDKLVDEAAKINASTAVKRLDKNVIRLKVLDSYLGIVNSRMEGKN